jgi:hypothetical protein
MIRDTLEYVQNKPAYDPNFFKARKSIINHGLEKDSPLSHFISQNGEVGETIRNNLNSFMEMVYSDDSTYITVDNDKLLVDHAQDLQALDFIIGLKETLCDVIKNFIKQTTKDGVGEEELRVMVTLDEQFYRILSSLIIFDKTNEAFLEFNKVMQENKGQPTPQSNFVINDLKRLVGFARFLQEHSDKEDKDYQDLFNKHFQILKYMEGSEKLPEGSNMKQEIDKVHGEYVNLLSQREGPWAMAYQQIWKELSEYEQAQLKKSNKKN